MDIKKQFYNSMDIAGLRHLDRQRHSRGFKCRVIALSFISLIMVLIFSGPVFCLDNHHGSPEGPVASTRNDVSKPIVPKQDVKKDVENVTVPPKIRKPHQVFDPIIVDAASRHNLDPALVKAVIMAESSFRPRAVSKRGARGLMQLMPKTAKSLGVRDAFDPEHNIRGGAKYLRRLLNRFNGDVRLGLAAYNAGSTNVRKYKGIPPYRATRIYIKKVLKYYREYKKEFNKVEENV